MKLTDPKIKSYKEYQSCRIFGDMIGKEKKVLNIGAGQGRDYYYLTQKNNCKVTNLDVIYSKVPNLVQCDVAKEKLPFKDGSFDIVIMSAILEHLWNDVEVLNEARRVLNSKGRIIVHVPYLNDKPEFHIRIHTPKSARRLVEFNGFKIEEFYSGGFMLSFAKIINALRKIMGIDITDWCVDVEKKFQFMNNKLYFLYGGVSGSYISASKSGSSKDVSKMNHDYFQKD